MGSRGQRTTLCHILQFMLLCAHTPRSVYVSVSQSIAGISLLCLCSVISINNFYFCKQIRGASQPESNKNCLQTLFAYILEPEAPSMSATFHHLSRFYSLLLSLSLSLLFLSTHNNMHLPCHSLCSLFSDLSRPAKDIPIPALLISCLGFGALKLLAHSNKLMSLLWGQLLSVPLPVAMLAVPDPHSLAHSLLCETFYLSLLPSSFSLGLLENVCVRFWGVGMKMMMGVVGLSAG